MIREEIYSLRETAAKLNVSSSTVIKWVDEGKLDEPLYEWDQRFWRESSIQKAKLAQRLTLPKSKVSSGSKSEYFEKERATFFEGNRKGTYYATKGHCANVWYSATDTFVMG